MPKKYLLRGMKRMFGVMLFTLVITSTYAADGDTLLAKTIEGIELTYQVISEADRTCRMIGSKTTHAIFGEVTIPSSVDNYLVVDIYYSAFAWCKDLTSVNIPNSVRGIYEGAFYGCI